MLMAEGLGKLHTKDKGLLKRFWLNYKGNELLLKLFFHIFVSR